MNRSIVAMVVAVAAVGAFAGCRPEAQRVEAGNRINIVLISSDTLRADRLGVNGHDRRLTPNLDALAASGANFTQAYAHAPNTAPSHTSILTSLFPSAHGVFEHGQSLDERVETLPEVLAGAGYATGGFTQLNGSAYEQGFDTWERLRTADQEGRGVDHFEPALDWVRDRGDAPFFLFLHSYNVHLPYAPPEEWRARWAGEYDGPLPKAVYREQVDWINLGGADVTDADRRYIVDLYDAEVAYYDQVLGAFLDEYRKLRQWDRTLFVFLSDHGEEFGEHGVWGQHSHTLRQELIRVPLIIAGPGVPVGVSVADDVQLVDVAPTILGLAGLAAPASFMGEDLRPAWRGRQRRPRMVVAERWKQRAMIWAGFKYYTDGRLFDLQEDPGETADIADADPETVGRMKRAMIDWLTEVLERSEGIERSSEVRLTPDEERRLRALGYLQ